MTLEELVRESIVDHTAGTAPTPDMAALTKQRRFPSQIVRLVPVVAAAAAVAVIVGGVFAAQHVVGGDAQPAPTPTAIPTPAPTTAAPTSPLKARSDLRIHLAGDEVSIGGARHTRQHGHGRALTVATRYGLVYIGDDVRPYLMLPDGTEVALARQLTDSNWRPTLVADPDGTTVAWTSSNDGRLTAHVYDLAQQREVASLASAASLIGLDDGVLVDEVPDGGGSSYRAWDAAGYGGFQPLRKGGRVAAVGVAGRTIFFVGPGGLIVESTEGSALAGWQTVRLTEKLGSRSPDDYHLSPDGRLQLLRGSAVKDDDRAGTPIVARDVVSGARTELAISADRLGTPRLAYDSDGSLLVLTRTVGGDGWSLYDCRSPQGGPEWVQCTLKESGIEDASFPGDSGYQAPFPS
ncbi:hypothetical protein FE697_012240 [Mumia zhuanghuii]|uniref:WD40-like Beta Propeller Repeat n=2 Tax=Mumia TaxID=1546255 RepID=A0ABW1QHV4_9ACTN|nr:MULTISPECIES: hypothetical protein [Mumia]KAA1422907.1 hypothetical protein FE697_012240 [Mumia zhuanghuii]